MYGKVFESIYDGSLACGDWEALITFQQLIVLADQDGVVDMTSIALHRRTTLPLEIIEKGLSLLQEPDPDSRTKSNEGRRITLIDEGRSWGWVIVNYKYYRDLASREDKRQKDKVRIAKKRAESKGNDVNTECRKVSQSVRDVAHKDVDVNTDTNIKPLSVSKPTCRHKEIIEIYHELLPELPSIVLQRYSGSSKEKNLKSRWNEDKAHQDLDFWRTFFTVVRSNPFWLGENDRGWKANFEWLMKRGNFDKVIERGES